MAKDGIDLHRECHRILQGLGLPPYDMKPDFYSGTRHGVHKGVDANGLPRSGFSTRVRMAHQPGYIPTEFS